jgi:hypothetical protein
MKPKSHLETLGAALLYALSAALYLRALLPQFTTHIAPDPYDPLFNVCVLDWVSRASFLGLHAALQFPIFFPSPDVLAYSDHFLGLGLLLGAARPLLDTLGVGPLTLYNSLYFGSFVLAGASLFWVARRLGIGRTAAFLGGFAYAFSHPRWDQSSHLQMLWAPVLPLVLWSFDQLLERPSRRTAAAFVALFAVHLTGGAYLAYMVNLALAGMAGTRLIDRSGREAIRRGWQAIAAAAIVAGLLLGLFLLPYAVAEREAGMQRTLVETQQFSGTAISWLQPSQWSWYERAFPGDLRRNENSLFLGFAVTLTLTAAGVAGVRGGVRRLTENPALWIGLGVAAVAVLATETMTWGSHFGYRRRLPPLSGGYIVGLFLLLVGCGIAIWAARRHRRPASAANDGEHATSRRAFLVAGVLCTAACFPVVFIPLRYLLPGLEGMRVPSRFALVAIIPWTLLAAAAWDGWLNRIALPKRRWALGGLALLLLLELFPRPLPTYALEDLTNLPQAYREVETNPAVRALLELPLAGKEEDEVRYMWRQIRHRKPIFNGYSGFEPEEHDRLRVALRTKPAREMPNGPEFERLRQLGITHTLVRHHSFSAPRDRRTFEHLVRRGILRPVTPPGSPRLFAISAPEAP